MPKTLIGVYWSARADTIFECRSRAVEHLRLVCALGQGLDRWFLKASRKPKTPTEIDVSSEEAVGALLIKGVNRRDVDRSVIEELGWSMSLWNGDLNGVSASTNLQCGCTSDLVENRAIVEISVDEGDGVVAASANELLVSLANLWSADSGVVSKSTWNPDLQRRDAVELASFQHAKR